MQLLLVVIAVSVVVLGISFAGLYFLNKAVNQNDR